MPNTVCGFVMYCALASVTKAIQDFINFFSPIFFGSRQIGPRAIFCGKLGPGRLGPGKLGPGKLGPRQIGPQQIGPRKMAPGKLCLSKLSSWQIGPLANWAPGKLGPCKLGPSKLGPWQTTNLPFRCIYGNRMLCVLSIGYILPTIGGYMSIEGCQVWRMCIF